MKVFEQFQNDDTAHVSIQLSASEYQSLRQWMHTSEGELVSFVHGVRLAKRGFGWFRLETSKVFRSIDKLKVSLAIVNKWHRDYSAKLNQELRLLLAIAAPTAQVTHFSTSNHSFTVKDSQGKTVHVGLHKDKVIVDPVKKVVDPNRLFALTQKFSHPHSRTAR